MCVCACSSGPGRAGWPPGRVLMRLNFPLAVLSPCFARPSPGWGCPFPVLLFACFLFFFFSRPRCLRLSVGPSLGCPWPWRPVFSSPSPPPPQCSFFRRRRVVSGFLGFRHRVSRVLALCDFLPPPLFFSFCRSGISLLGLGSFGLLFVFPRPPFPPLFSPFFLFVAFCPPPPPLVFVWWVSTTCYSAVLVLPLHFCFLPRPFPLSGGRPFCCDRLVSILRVSSCCRSLFRVVPLLFCSCLLACRSSAVVAACRPPPSCCACCALCCLVSPRCAGLPSGVLRCRVAVLWAACRAVVSCLAFFVGCCALWGVLWGVLLCVVLSVAAVCCAVSLIVLSCCFVCVVACCLVLVCVAVCYDVSLGAVLWCVAARCTARRSAVMGFVGLSRSVSCRCALGPSPGRCLLPWSPVSSGAVFRRVSPRCVLCAVCWCVLKFAAVLCAVCVPGCCAVCSLSSLLCAVLRCAVLVRLRRAVCLLCAVSGAWCCGALLSVVPLPVVLCCAAACRAVSSCGLLCCAAALGVGGWLACCVLRVARRPCSPLVPCFPVLWPVVMCFHMVTWCAVLLRYLVCPLCLLAFFSLKNNCKIW